MPSRLLGLGVGSAAADTEPTQQRRQACTGSGTAQAPGSSSQKTSRGSTATRNAWESKSPSPKGPTHPSPLQGVRV
jgi:hypothetical protein